MAKLHFRYGAMNSGKTTILLQTAHNYEERDQKVIIIKPSIDTKGGKTIISRIGVSREVDELITKDESIINKVRKYFDNLACLLVDEAQFLTKEQVKELFYITKIYNIPVIAFGLRTDFKGDLFEASSLLLGYADAIEEMPTICRCGKKARFNGRRVNNKFVSDGDSVLIDGESSKVTYESLCGECFAKEVLKLERRDD